MPDAGLRATCERTTAPADLVLPVWALGAAYLGGTGLGAMAKAGLITAREPDLSSQRAGDPGGHPPLEYVQRNGAAQ